MVIYLTHLLGGSVPWIFLSDFICSPETEWLGISKLRLMGPVSLMAWLAVAWGSVILVMMVYSWSPGIFLMAHSTELAD